MTPVQKWTLKLTEARGKLGDALERRRAGP